MDETQIHKASDTFRAILPWGMTILLSCWGGAVNYITKNRRKQFRIKELTLDLVIASFAGVMTSLLCNYANLNNNISACLIAISGHMGTRSIRGFEILRERMLNIQNPTNPSDGA